MILLKIALRNVFRHRGRSLITLSAIVFGCTSIILVGGFFDNLFWGMRIGYINSSTGHIQVFRRGFNERGRREPFKHMIEDPDALGRRLRQWPEVVSVIPQVNASGLLSTGENTTSVVVQGIDPTTQAYDKLDEVLAKLKKYARAWRSNATKMEKQTVLLEEGEGFAPGDGFVGLLGRGLAEAIEAKPGDMLVLVANSARGYINAVDVRVKGIISSPIKALDDVLLQIPLPVSRTLLHTDAVQALVVRLSKTEDTDRVAREFSAVLPKEGFDIEVKTWVELNDFYVKTVALFTRFFLVLKGIVTIIVVLSIFNTMNMAVMERVNEVGTIMALGTRPRGVMNLFLLEGLALGTLGGLIGVAVGAAVTKTVGWIGIPMPPPPGSYNGWLSTPTVVPSMLVFSFFLSIGTALVSSALPARKAARLEVADALRKVN